MGHAFLGTPPLKVHPHPEVPGEPTTTGTTLLETVAAAIQGFGSLYMARLFFITSIDAMVFVCSCRFHFYAHDMTRQVEARHFCGHQNEEMRQCLVYNSPEPDARLIGVEYIISEHLFLALSDRQDLEKVCKTYGKTLHFWQIDKGDDLPLALPQVICP
ncbi:hypothetical protein Peur_011892 [Populus x canadensis]